VKQLTLEALLPNSSRSKDLLSQLFGDLNKVQRGCTEPFLVRSSHFWFSGWLLDCFLYYMQRTHKILYNLYSFIPL